MCISMCQLCIIYVNHVWVSIMHHLSTEHHLSELMHVFLLRIIEVNQCVYMYIQGRARESIKQQREERRWLVI